MPVPTELELYVDPALLDRVEVHLTRQICRGDLDPKQSLDPKGPLVRRFQGVTAWAVRRYKVEYGGYEADVDPPATSRALATDYQQRLHACLAGRKCELPAEAAELLKRPTCRRQMRAASIRRKTRAVEF